MREHCSFERQIFCWGPQRLLGDAYQPAAREGQSWIRTPTPTPTQYLYIRAKERVKLRMNGGES